MTLPILTVKSAVITATAYIDYNNTTRDNYLALVDTVGPTDSIAFVRDFNRTIDEVLTAGDSLTPVNGPSVSKSITDTATPADATTFQFGLGRDETLTASDTVSLAPNLGRADGVTFTDVIQIDHGILLTDNVTPGDSVVSAIVSSHWNPSDISSLAVLSNSNKTVTSSGGQQGARADTGHSTGKVYFAVQVAGTPSVAYGIGIAKAGVSLTFGGPGHTTDGAQAEPRGQVQISMVTVDATSPAFTTSDIIGVAVDLDAGQIYFQKNGTWFTNSNTSGVQDPVTGANAYGGIVPGTVYYPQCYLTNDMSYTFVPGTPPTGYSQWT